MPRFHVVRSIQMNATPDEVFAKVADFKTWKTWSPWLCSEPDAQVDISDDSSSVGSTYAWKGEIVGEGVIEHRQLEPGRLIDEEIRFVKPFRSKSQVQFELEPIGAATKISWHMHGSLPWFLFWMRSSMEFFIGMDYERGLRMLKQWIETGQVLSQTTIVGVKPLEPLRVAGVRQTCAISEIGPSMEAAFTNVAEKIEQHHLPTGDRMASVYHDMNIKLKTFDYTTGYIVPDSADSLPHELSICSIPKGRALTVQHIGSYEHLGNAWSTAHQYVRYKKLKLSKAGGLEIYENCPGETPPAELRASIMLPLR